MTLVALVDVDGTLVDTNYHHALAWSRALRGVGLTFPLWRIHRHIGMGGDQFVPALAGDDVERRHGDRLRDAWAEEFEPFLPEIAAVEGAHDFLVDLREAGARVVLASSGKPEHVEAFLDIIDGRDVADAWTTSQDVERTKPAPDLLEAALAKLDDVESIAPEHRDVVVIGDSTWDCVAAGRLGARSLALLTGGFSREELREAGAQRVYDSLPELGTALANGGLSS
jgi:phosphoglycolate phosphatase-like HAD superfamily hydrolase